MAKQKITLKEALSKAEDAVRKGNTALAIKIYAAILRQQPNNSPIEKILRKLKDEDLRDKSLPEPATILPQNEIGSLPLSINLEPSLDQVNFLNNLYSRGKFQELLDRSNQFLRYFPNSFILYGIQGAARAGLKQLDAAIDSYKKAIKIRPDHASTYNNIGIAYKKNGALDLAIDSYKKAIEIEPDYAVAYNNLGNAYGKKGDLDLAISSYKDAIKNDESYNDAKVNLVRCLTEYESQTKDFHPIISADQEISEIVLHTDHSDKITDRDIARICSDGLDILKRNEVKIQFPVLQAYRRNGTGLNCKRHKAIFNDYNVIPEFCFGCYKVQVEPTTVLDLIKLFLVFDKIGLQNNNNRKCMIETRPEISGFYKGLIYCVSLEEAYQVREILDVIVKKSIGVDLSAKVKRGCSEYPLAFPQYTDICRSGPQPMAYDEEWRSIEKKYDLKNPGQSKLERFQIITKFNLNDVLVIRNWLACAQEIGDQSVNQITSENFGNLNIKELLVNRNNEQQI